MTVHKIFHPYAHQGGVALGCASKIVQNALEHQHKKSFISTQKCRIHPIVVPIEANSM